MSAIKLASRYARALLEFAVSKEKLDEVYQDQLYLLKSVKASKDFSHMLGSPLISSDRKLKALQAVLGGQVNDLTMQFLKLLLRKSREVYVKDVAESFLLQYDEFKHITQVKVTSAAPLEQSQVESLLNKLKQQAQLENINLTTEVDESLLGGFVLQYGDKQYDASIARQVNILKKDLESNEYLRKLR